MFKLHNLQHLKAGTIITSRSHISPARLSLTTNPSFTCACTSTRDMCAEAIMYAKHGPAADVLHLKGTNPPEHLPPDSICVNMLAAPINPSDINQAEGKYPIKPPLPAVGGNEGVGVVQRIGSQVQCLAPGDWVVPLTAGQGTWRSSAAFPAANWHRVPNSLPLATAASLSVNPVTAVRMLTEFVDLEPGDVIIQNGGNSNVGRAVIQVARAKDRFDCSQIIMPATGWVTVNVVRDRPSLQDLKLELTALGADMVTTEETLKADMASSQLPRPRLALNCVGGSCSAAVAKTLQKGATMVTYGGMSMKPVTLPTSLLIFNDLRSCGFWLSLDDESPEQRAKKAKAIDYVVELIQQKRFVSDGDLVPYKDFMQALQSGRKAKQVLRFNE